MRPFLYGLGLLGLVLSVEAAQWNYNLEDEHGPEHWGGVCGSGVQQSPINIPMKGVEKSMLPELSFQNYATIPKSMELVNNGHTLQVNIHPESADLTPKMEEGGLPASYKLLQLHFHWGGNQDAGSEHLIGNKSFPLELHLVHYQSKYDTITEALEDSQSDSLAVLGVLFQLSEEENEELNQILDHADQVIQPKQRTQIDAFSVKSLIPEDMSKFYRYQGSLTTPPCLEIVQWTVLKSPLTVSKRQLEKFSALKEFSGKALVDTFRPTQPIGNRRIKDVTTFSETTYSGSTQNRFLLSMAALSVILAQCA